MTLLGLPYDASSSFLRGDHSVAYPILRAVRRHRQRLTVLQLDAHPALYDVRALAAVMLHAGDDIPRRSLS